MTATFATADMTRSAHAPRLTGASLTCETDQKNGTVSAASTVAMIPTFTGDGSRVAASIDASKGRQRAGSVCGRVTVRGVRCPRNDGTWRRATRQDGGIGMLTAESASRLRHWMLTARIDTRRHGDLEPMKSAQRYDQVVI